MIQLNLLLPANISIEFFDVTIQATYNLMLIQVLLRLSIGLSKGERERLKAQYIQNQTVLGDPQARSAGVREDGSLGAAMGRIIANMEIVKLYVS